MGEPLISDIILARLERGISVRQLGRETGVSFSSLARQERGEGRPSLVTRIALLEWLGRDATAERQQLAHQSPNASLQTRVANLEFLLETLVQAVQDLQGAVHTFRFPCE